ncbi:MAG: hypothetical protein ACXVZU_02535 [Methanobacteriaceae archaeon]
MRPSHTGFLPYFRRSLEARSEGADLCGHQRTTEPTASNCNDSEG